MDSVSCLYLHKLVSTYCCTIVNEFVEAHKSRIYIGIVGFTRSKLLLLTNRKHLVIELPSAGNLIFNVVIVFAISFYRAMRVDVRRIW